MNIPVFVPTNIMENLYPKVMEMTMSIPFTRQTIDPNQAFTRRTIDQSASGNSMAPKSIAAISHDEKEELKNKGIKVKEKGKEEDEMETNMEVEEVIKEEESEFETDEEVNKIFEEEE
ncbi:hypothetical protein Tco_0295660 [Tanacetum coccineum]